MKFKLKDGAPFKAYGYVFAGEPVDVTEEHLIIKFGKYHQLEEVKAVSTEPKKTVKKKAKKK